VEQVSANARTGNVLVRFDAAKLKDRTLRSRAQRAARAAETEAPSATEPSGSEDGSEHRRRPLVEGQRTLRRARIAVRGMDRDSSLAARVESVLGGREGVHLARASPLTGRVLVEFDDARIALEDLIGAVAEVELPPVPDDEDPLHPLDPAPLMGGAARAVAAAIGLGLLAVRRVAGAPGPPVSHPAPVQIAAGLGIVEGLPALREAARRMLGEGQAELLFGGAAVAALTLSGSPLGVAMAGASALRTFSEARARGAAWRDYEERLRQAAPASPEQVVTLAPGSRAPWAGEVLEGSGTMLRRDGSVQPVGPGDIVVAGARLWGGAFRVRLNADPPFEPEPRPVPPRDLRARYLELLGPGSLIYAGLTAVLTRSPGRAMIALLLVNARAALIGEASADAAARERVLRAGVTVAATCRSRPVRRPNVLLLDGARIMSSRLEVSGVTPLAEDLDRDDVLELAGAVAAAAGSPWGPAFPPGRRRHAVEGQLDDGVASAIVSGEGYALGRTAVESIAATEAPLARGELPLALRRQRDGRVLGLVTLRPRLSEGTRTLLEMCQRHGVAIAAVGDQTPTSLALAERANVPLLAGEALAAVRIWQSTGAVVGLVSDTAHAARALTAADLAIALSSGHSARFPARADLVAPDLRAVAAAVDTGARRDLTVRDSVLLSATANLGGAIWGLRSGPGVRSASRLTYLAALAAMADGWWRLRGGRRHAAVAARLVDPRPERWGLRSPDEVLRELDADPRGLTDEQAAARLVPRQASERGNTFVTAISEQLRSPLVGVLLAGAGLSLALGAFADVVMIAAVIAANAAVGAWQEGQADRTAEELERIGAATAVVQRRTGIRTLSADAVVPGDILVLAPGDRIGADARLLAAEGLEVDEAPLTGESLPVAKSPDAPEPEARVVLEGSDVTVGTGRAVVVAVGQDTRLGATAAAIALDEDGRTPLDARLQRILRAGLPLVVGGGAVVTLAGVLWRRSLMSQLALGASIGIAAVPEGLPLLTGVAQAAVALRLAERRALVRRLSAVEALGRVDVACADKTGTLTEGRLAVTMVADLEDEGPPSRRLPDRLRAILLAAGLASPRPGSAEAEAHPTDVAVIQAARMAGLDDELAGARLGELPFEPDRSFHAAAVDGRLVAKGATEALVHRCRRIRTGGTERALDDQARHELFARSERLAERGLRLLLVAEGPVDASLEDPQGLTALGFIGISDPLRGSVPAAISRCREAGVRVIMLTGDHPATAAAIAEQAGLAADGRPVLTGSEIAELDENALDRRLEEADVIARITPLDKLRIVERLQARGHTVAMTGDGVNDAPALRLADVGVAMGAHGTEVARQAGDLVLADDEFSTLAEALVEGRAFWLNIRRALGLLLGGNLGELGLMIATSVMGHSAPMSTRQILAVNLVSDVLPAVAVAVQPPEHRDLASLAREGATNMDERLRTDVVRRGIATAAPAFAAYLLAARTSPPLEARTVAFASIVATQLGQTWELGRREGTLSRPVMGAVGATGALTAAAIALPPLNRFLGFAVPSPLGILLVAGATVAAVALGRQDRGGTLESAAALDYLLPRAELQEPA
jgi:calcium-translocating P-type ATPase